MQGNVYTGVMLSPGDHLTRYDAFVLPGTEALAHGLNEGRHLVRTPGVGSLVAFEGPDGVYMSVSADASARQGSDFLHPVCIAAPDKGLCPSHGRAHSIQLAVGEDRASALWVAWCDASQIHLARVSVARTKLVLHDRVFVACSGARLTSILVDQDRGVWLGVQRGESPRSEVGVFRYESVVGEWAYERFFEMGESVALVGDELGRVHAAVTRFSPYAVPERLRGHGWSPRHLDPAGKGRYVDPEVHYVVWEPGEGWSEPQLAAHGISRRPAIALVDSRPLIVFQVEGQKAVNPFSGDYLFQREGGGSGIGYAWLGPGGWQRGDVAIPSEILVQERCEADVYKGRLYPMVEEMGPPSIVCDHHGVAWAIWNNTTRRHTYFSRWLGSSWSDPYELAGSFYALTAHVGAETALPKDATEFGVALLAAGRLYYLTTHVPSLDPTDPRHVLFLDLLDLSEVQNVELHLNTFERYPKNPVLGPGEEGARDDTGVSFPHVRVFNGRYIMHYHMRGRHRSSDQEENRMGYAESDDGIQWVKPSISPGDDPTVLPSGPDNSVPWVSGNFIDDEEADRNRRFKGVTLTGKWTQTQERWLVTSADGKYWRVEGPAEDIYCILEAGGPSFRDPDAPADSRFRAVGRSTSTSGRALGMMMSADLLQWHGKESLLDVDDPYGRPAMLRRGGFVSGRILDPIGERGAHQIYWGVVWKEHGLYLCLYAPYTWDGRYDVAMAVSRDGLNFMRVKNGERILSCGESGHWDRGSLAVGYGFGKPLALEDRMRLYYSASTGHHGTKPWGSVSCIGFADLPLDGYTALRVRRDGPRLSGAVATVPFTIPKGFRPAVGVRVGPHFFYGSTDEAPPSGTIVAELIDAVTGVPVPQFEAERCRGCTTPGVHTLEWPEADPSHLTGRRVKLRLVIKGLELWLHGFWFVGGGA